jgi:hypothetical protein
MRVSLIQMNILGAWAGYGERVNIGRQGISGISEGTEHRADLASWRTP